MSQEPAAQPQDGFTTRRDQPLIGIPSREGSDEVVHYFSSEEEADKALSRHRDSIQRALDLAGAWQELDSEDSPDPLDELDRMRHETKPTPPLKL